jgi:nucleotide-binding universal stress UspA family protein
MRGDSQPALTRLREAIPGYEANSCICWVGSVKQQDIAFEAARLMAAPRACHIVMCLDTPQRLRSAQSESPRRQQPLTPEHISTAEAMLRHLYGQGAQVMVLPGNPITEIRRYAHTHGVKLIVMGEQASALEKEYGARLVDDAPCSVLLFINPPPRRSGRGAP